MHVPRQGGSIVILLLVVVGWVLPITVHAGQILASVDEPRETYINKPDFVPRTRFGFDDEIFREQKQKPFERATLKEPIRTSLGSTTYTLGFHLYGGTLTERFHRPAATTISNGTVGFAYPEAWRTETRPDVPLIEHRIEYGRDEGRGPRLELSYASSDDVSGFNAYAGETAGTADAPFYVSSTDGRRTRLRVALSWPLRPAWFDHNIEEVRAFVGYARTTDEQTRYDGGELGTTGTWAQDEVDMGGLLFGVRGGWNLRRGTDFVLEMAATLLDVDGSRDYRLDGLSYDYGGEGWGWDLKAGLYFHRRRMTYEVALTAFSLSQTGADGHFTTPTGTVAFEADETEAAGAGLTLAAQYHF